MKKRILFVLPLMWAIYFGLISLDMNVVTIPLWISVLTAVLISVVSIALIYKVRSGKGLKVSLALLCALSVFMYFFAGIICNPYWNSNTKHKDTVITKDYDKMLTSKEAVEDLDYMMKFLKKDHPACRKGVPPEVQERYESVRSELQSIDQISVNELNAKTEYVLTCLHDGHTYTLGKYDRHLLKAYYTEELEDCEVVAVNGVSLDDLIVRCKDLYSYEAESWELYRIKSLIISVEGLDYMGFDTSSVTYTFSKNGETFDKTYTSSDFVTSDQIAKKDDSSSEKTFVSYVIDEDHDLAIMTLDSCIINDEYRDTVKKMFTEVKAKDIGHVAVDIRNNGGGNDAVIGEFFRYLDIDEYKSCGLEWRLGPLNIKYPRRVNKNEKVDDLLFKGDFYLLTSSGSFSSAMLYAQYVKDNSIGTIIGEPPGNDPNGYGEIAVFNLPNSGILMSVSTKHFMRADKDAKGLLIEPDVPCDADDAMDRLYEITGEDK